MSVLDALDDVLAARRHADPGTSYVASLHAKGINKILEKVGEEAVEVIIAAKDLASGGDIDAVIRETADLWFHNLVLLSHFGKGQRDVLAELERRFGVSGHDEKANR